jgi:hypothetical protein
MYRNIEDVEEEFAKAKKDYKEIKEQLSINGLSKQEKNELKRKRKQLVRELNILAKVLAVENRTVLREEGDKGDWKPYSRRTSSTSKIIGYLMFQFMLLIFQIVSFSKIISILAVFTSIVFFITFILISLLARKTNRPMWTKNKEKIEKPLFQIIILLTIANLLLGVIILLFL